MKPMLHPDMLEATRLTRAGRLIEATRLIQQLLDGGTASDAAMRPASIETSPARVSTTIDGTAERIEDAEVQVPRAQRTEIPSSTDPSETAEALALSLSTRRLRGLPMDFGSIGNKPLAGLARSRPAPALPEGAQFLTRSFTGTAGSRTYKLFIPSRYRGEPLPLVVMLHGCTQSADDFAAGTQMNAVAEEHGLLVAYPEQAKSANAQRCWNWFNPGDQQRGIGEPALIAGITRQIASDYTVDAGRIYLAGLSAGGAAAATMAVAYPDLYAAVGVHSGLPAAAAKDLPSAFAAMREGGRGAAHGNSGATVPPGASRVVPTIVFHGDRDMTVHPSNGNRIIEQIRLAQPDGLRMVTQRARASAGRGYSRTCHLDAGDRAMLEMWIVHGGGHAWSGGSAAGSYTDPHGPDASREMIRFFLQHTRPASPAS